MENDNVVFKNSLALKTTAISIKIDSRMKDLMDFP